MAAAVVPKWDDTTEVAQATHDAPKWEDTVEHAPQAKPGMVESVGRGLLQGGTLGFADEAYGGAKALYDAARKGSLEDFADVYSKERDSVRDANRAAEEANPKSYMGGNIAGSLATAVVPGLNVAKAATLGGRAALAAGAGAAAGLGNSTADLTQGDVGGAAVDTGLGAVLGAAGQGVGEKLIAPAAAKLGQLASPIRDRVSRFIGDKAARLAENATGATAKQSEKFVGAPGETGRELLDRGFVRFGDSAKNIAERAEATMASDGANIGSILSELDKKGVTVNRDSVIATIDQKIAGMKADPSQAHVVDQLENIKSAIAAGPASPSISAAEQTKRGFQAKVKGGWSDPNAQVGNKVASQTYREAVEDAARTADPGLGQAFKDSKQTTQLLAPVEEAAARRAGQLKQHVFGGLLDVSAGVLGSQFGEDSRDSATKALLFAAARRTLMPRAAASGAVGLDKVSKALMGNPKVLGKFAEPLAKAAARGNKALAATQYLMQQRDPEFSEMKKKLEEANE